MPKGPKLPHAHQPIPLQTSRIRDTTLADSQLAAKHAKATFADKPLRVLTPLNFQRLYQTLIDAGLAPSTVR